MSNTNVIRTGMAGLLQSCHYFGKPYEVLPNSTLNQKLGINADLVITEDETPVTQYIAIGNGGHGFIVGANNKVKWQGLHHKARETALFNQLPFVLRLPSEDLTATERLRYRLRRLETYGGVTYVAYYMRVLDLSDTKPSLELRHVENGVTTSTPFEPTLDDLNPVASTLTTGSAVTTTGDYLASTAKVVFSMTADEVAEFVSACEIIYGETGYAVISEMAVVAGVDRTVKGDFSGTQQAYTDVVSAQVMSFITTSWVMEYQTDGIALTVDVGNVEPLQTTASS